MSLAERLIDLTVFWGVVAFMAYALATSTTKSGD
jgi:hypothetical protein